MDAMDFMKRIPRVVSEYASRHEARRTPRSARLPSSLHPDCEEAVARCQPSAPAFDRIC
jgi:hypothetical protein